MTAAVRRRRRIPSMLLIGAILGGLMVVLGIVGPLIWGARANARSADIRQRPSATHWLGTDALGHDVFLQTLVAARPTLLMAATATAMAVVIGTLLGAGVAAMSGPFRVLGDRVIDLWLSYPPIITALVVTAIFAPGAVTVVVAIGLAFSPQFARMTNRLARSVEAKDYVSIARALGVGRWKSLIRHIIPNISGPLLVLTSVAFASCVLVISGLSFLGLGVQAPSYDWGSLLSDGLRNLYINPGQALGPAIAVLLTGLAAGLIGDGLVRWQDPRSQPNDRVGHPSAAHPDTPEARQARRPSATPGGSEVADPPGSSNALEVRDLTVGLPGGATLVDGVTFHVAEGEILGLVGESGSGKSLTSLAASRLLPAGLTWSASRLVIAGRELSDPAATPPAQLATEVGIVFQDPAASFNPALRIGSQLTETLTVHRRMPKRQAVAAAVERLRETRVSSPELRMRQYPHQLSGGMRQRAMIAAALLAEPRLIVADEPTTALDVTVQAEVLRLLKHINAEHGTSILLISHDISVVSALCDRVCVMRDGRIVEELPVDSIRRGTVAHPYTRQLLAASPHIRASAPPDSACVAAGPTTGERGER